MSRADPSEDSTPKPITKAKLEGSALHVTVMDGNEPFEFTVTLKDDDTCRNTSGRSPANHEADTG